MPGDEVRMEVVQADFWTWSDENKTLDFYGAQAGRNMVDLLVKWLESAEKNELDKDRVMKELPALLKLYGEFRVASFERTSVIGHFRGRSSVVYMNPEKAKDFLA